MEMVGHTPSAASVAVAAAVTIRHSRLCGSEDLENAIRASHAAILTFLRTRLFDPVKELRDELKAAFVSDRPDDAIERLEESKSSSTACSASTPVRRLVPGTRTPSIAPTKPPVAAVRAKVAGTRVVVVPGRRVSSPRASKRIKISPHQHARR